MPVTAIKAGGGVVSLPVPFPLPSLPFPASDGAVLNLANKFVSAVIVKV